MELLGQSQKIDHISSWDQPPDAADTSEQPKNLVHAIPSLTHVREETNLVHVIPVKVLAFCVIWTPFTNMI